MQKLPTYAAYFAAALSIITLALLLLTGLGPKPWDAVNALAAAFSGLVAFAGLLFVGFQIRSSRKLAKAQFVNELARDIDNHCETESKLDRDGAWYSQGVNLGPAGMEQIERYLTFFERVKFILDNGALDITRDVQLF